MPRVAVPLSLKTALSVFLSEKTRRRLGTVRIWTSPLHGLTFSLGCIAGCNTESLPHFLASTEFGHPREEM